MATSGLYGSTSTGTVAPQSGSESVGLYGNNTVFGGSYFEYFIFLDSATAPATPTGGSWSFVTNVGTPPAGWSNTPPASPTNKVWVSIALVNSKSTATLTWSVPGVFVVSGGTVTNVSALTLGTTGTDVSSTVANSTTTPVITLNLPTASATNRGALSAADWTTFNNKGTGSVTSVSGTAGRVTSTGGVTPVIDLASGIATPGTTGSATLVPVVTIDTYGRVTSITTAANPQGTVTSVTGTAPVVSSGGTTPAISMAAATASVNGYLTSTDWTTFNSKGSGSVTSVAATVPSFLSVAGSPITTSGTLAISYSGTALPVANGGTGVTASSGANSVVLRDANQNIAANSFNDSYSNIAASGTGITLTVSSARRYTITGSGGQVFTLPDATTLTNGSIFEFDNNQSSGAITVNNNSSTLIVSVPSGAIVRIDLLSNASAAGSWDKHSLTPSNVSWSTNTFDYPGSITSATWNGVAVAVNRGGTGLSAGTSGGVPYFSSTSTIASSAALAANALVIGGGAGVAPSTTTTGTGVVTALGVNTGSAGAFVVNGGALGTPSSGVMTNVTGINYDGFKNRIINGAMVIDQRNAGAAVTTNTAFPVDRFAVTFSADGAFSAQQSSITPAGFINSVKFTTTTADAFLTGTQRLGFVQRIEGLNIADLAWGTASAATVTLSFWVRSSLTGTFGGTFKNSDNNRSYPFTYTISVADTWEQKSVTVAGDTSGTWLTTNGVGIRVEFGLGCGPDGSGTAGAWTASNLFSATGAVSVIGTLNATWYVTGVQLEKGSTATSFDVRSYGTELGLCKRYYDVLLAANTDYNIIGTRDSTTSYQIMLYTAVPMRTTPTLGVPSGYGRVVCWDVVFNLTVLSISAMSLSYAPDNRLLNIFMTTSSGSGAATVFNSYDTAGATTTMTVSAEL